LKVIVKKVKPIIDAKVRRLCRKPYRGHTKGCPNYNKKKGCPPQVRLWHEVCNVQLPTYICYTKFNLGKHVSRMRTMHPNWSKYQLRCCLYWQPRARKTLKEYGETIKKTGMLYTMVPEAMGINVTKMMRNMGIEIWPPVRWVYQVALYGYLL
jgi:predicted metal-binding protein